MGIGEAHWVTCSGTGTLLCARYCPFPAYQTGPAKFPLPLPLVCQFCVREAWGERELDRTAEGFCFRPCRLLLKSLHSDMHLTAAKVGLLLQNPPGLREGLGFLLSAKLRPYYESLKTYSSIDNERYLTQIMVLDVLDVPVHPQKQDRWGSLHMLLCTTLPPACETLTGPFTPSSH